MRKNILIMSVLLIVLAVPTLHTSRAAAIETSGIGALPAHPRLDNPRTRSIFVYDVAADDSVTDGVKVVNNTDSAKTLEVYPVDSQASSDGAFACAQKVDPKKEVGNWIKLSKNEVTLAANTSQTVPFTLTTPKIIKPGEHNGCIVVQDAAPSTKKAGNGIILSFRSALRVAITTPGALRADLSFVDVKSQNISKKKLGISPVIANHGNVSVDASLEVTLAGVLAGQYPFSTSHGQFTIFTEHENRFNFEIEKPFWGGWYKRKVEATYRKPLPSGQTSDNVTTIRAKDAVVFIKPQLEALLIEIVAMIVVVASVAYLLWKFWLYRKLASRATATYKVLAGDTVESIARNVGITWRQLAKINKIPSPYNLVAGQTLKVPPPKPKPMIDSKPNIVPPQPPQSPMPQG